MISRGQGSGSNIHLHASTDSDTSPERTMLTTAEELGLSGVALSSRVQRALYGLPESQLAGLIEQLRQGAVERHVVYLRDNEVEPVRILPCPITVVPDQLASFPT